MGGATAEAGPHIEKLAFTHGLVHLCGWRNRTSRTDVLIPESFACLACYDCASHYFGDYRNVYDPYGAAILVSATIAEVAYQSGINPVHFWMVVLVAFGAWLSKSSGSFEPFTYPTGSW